MDIGALAEVKGTRGVVHAFGNRPLQDGAAVMVVDPLDIRREHRAIVLVDLDRKVCPPHKGLRVRRAVVDLHLRLEIGLAGNNGDARHALHAEQRIDFTDPDRLLTVFALGDRRFQRHKGRRAVVLRPVELDTAGHPRACKADHRRLDDLVVINEVIIVGLIQRALNLAADLGQDLKLDVLVLEYSGVIGHILLLVADTGRERDRIEMSACTLIRLLLKKHRERFARSGFVSRDDEILKLGGCFLSHDCSPFGLKKEFFAFCAHSTTPGQVVQYQ